MKAVFVAVAGLALATSCTPDYGEENQAPVLIRITQVEGAAGGGGEGSGIGTVLNSDVSTNGSIFNDNATVTVVNLPKNQSVDLTLGQLNDVILERYEVRYVRSDGHEQEGVDVPFRITGPMSAVVPVNGESDVPITIVRHQAKLEAPLASLSGGGGALVLTTTARITIHGRTVSGKVVTTQAALQVTFADFADE